MKRKMTVTVLYMDHHKDVHEADRFTTETVQWRLDQDTTILLIPIAGVRSVSIENNA